jgi:hypothetical protein
MQGFKAGERFSLAVVGYICLCIVKLTSKRQVSHFVDTKRVS